MERFFLECAIRVALIVGCTAILLRLMRVKIAAEKHRVWVGVLILMLVLPVETAFGPKAPLRLLPPLAQTSVSRAIVPTSANPFGILSSQRVSIWEVFLVGIYLSGLSLLLFRLTLGTVRARKLVREAVLHDAKLISRSCSAPVTVGWFRPVIILPEHWCRWPEGRLEAVLTHEGEHARRRDSLVQWFALLNRALFWFHPAAWWLERTLSALAEEACDNAVLALGHDPHKYAESLIDMARSVTDSGARLRITGIAMPGTFLRHRIQQILEGAQQTGISRTRMALVFFTTGVTCTAFAAGTLDHARQNSFLQRPTAPQAGSSDRAATTKFVLGGLKIEGEVHDRDGVENRVFSASKGREYDDSKQLVGAVAEAVREDFQERGYFKVVVHDPTFEPLGISDGKQTLRVLTSVTEGDQFRLKSLTIQNVPPDRALSIPAATLRSQFHLQDGDLLNVSEIRAGMKRVMQLYRDRGHPDVAPEPATQIDDATHQIDFILRITEGRQKL